MAKQGALSALSNGGLSELWARLRFLFMAIIVYRIGAHIPVPGINPDRLADLFRQNEGTILSLFNMFSGGALERMSIFAGIVAGLPSAIGQSFESARQGDINIFALIAIGLLAVAIIGFVVFIERGQRRIAVHYAKRQQGRKVFAAQTSHLPLKVNMAGVIPAIFASSLLLFPASLGAWFGQSEGLGWLQDISQAIAPGQPLNILLFSAGIIFFCFFYTALMFNPKDVAENLKKSGAFIPGIRPGEQSARYIDGVLTRL